MGFFYIVTSLECRVHLLSARYQKKKKSRPALRERTRDQLIHQRLLRTLRGVRGGGP